MASETGWGDKLASYGELLGVVDNAPVIIKEMRRARGQSMHAVAEFTGLSSGTIQRFEQTGKGNIETLRALLNWLEQG